MQYGVVFPQIEFGNDPQAIKDDAQTAEGIGYDSLLVYDHVLERIRSGSRSSWVHMPRLWILLLGIG